ncbi:invasion associated locus B family protein [Jiella marina]|uniref:invasion associated locus B family protein n=1 Tax=Jiella sp. LLJ827 TaxID=2917712 RepID=UPI0021013E58|nr:invasion associated locus B family protein [Jiella sp. LLJ827]MCQ0988628.1 invasion associated locus B family protein [Jiella sp. LLJ827]
MTRTAPASAKLGIVAAVLCLVLGLGFALAPAVSQAQNGQSGGAAEAARPEAQAPAPEVRQPWSVTCAAPARSADLVCTMQQSLRARATGQRLFAASVAKGTEGGQPQMRLSLPHGVVLTEGIELWVDSGDHRQVAIRTADQNGSYASLPLEPALIEAMKSGRTLNAGVVRETGGKVVFQLSLAGFTAAFEKL